MSKVARSSKPRALASEATEPGEVNLGTIDRVLRILAGVSLLSFVAFGTPAWVGLAGLVLVLTAAIGFCPLYALLGLRTRAAHG